jgi:phage N-6-adenine-methyltransferase
MDDKTRKVMHSSAKGDWGTPQWLFDRLDAVFEFTRDAAASEHNTKCDCYYDQYKDALTRSWGGDSVWLNPPYGRGIGEWITKAAQHKTVALLPARPETKWFQTVWKQAEVVCFIEGRLKFEGAQHAAPFPSCLAVFGQAITPRQMRVLEELGRCVRWKV